MYVQESFFILGIHCVVKMGFTILACFVATLSLVFCDQNFDKAGQTIQAARDIQQPFIVEFPDNHKQQKRRDDSQNQPNNLKIAAFNVQTFGKKKMETPGIPELLVKVGVAEANDIRFVFFVFHCYSSRLNVSLKFCWPKIKFWAARDIIMSYELLLLFTVGLSVVLVVFVKVAMA